jgi:deoxyribodipyrimidine photolyase-like uncharacterized protein
LAKSSTLVSKNTTLKIWIFASDEYRLDVQLQSIGASLTIPSEAFDSEHFTLRDTNSHNFLKVKVIVDGNFYRNMRKKNTMSWWMVLLLQAINGTLITTTEKISKVTWR